MGYSVKSMSKLVGRDRVLARMNEAVAVALDGTGAACLLTGDAGIGKSRLLHEIAGAARSAGFETLTGACYEDDATLPFSWLADMLRRNEERSARLNTALSEASLASLRRLTASGASSDGPDPNLALRLVRRLVADGPLLVAAEDVHWSDDAGLAVVRMLCRAAADLPLLFVVTARTEGIAGDHVEAVMEEVRRTHTGQVHLLAPLDLEGVAALSRDLLGFDELDPAAVKLLLERTDGNPFFVEEILSSILDEGLPFSDEMSGQIPVPRTVKVTVRRRMRRFSSVARRVAEAAAIEGRRFELENVAAVCGNAPADTLIGLAELVESGMVREDGPGEFSFRHALVREAVEEIVLGWDRRTLHARLATWLEAREVERPGLTHEISHHWSEAADWARALPAALRAAARDLDLGAPSAALRELERAVRAAEQLGDELPRQALRLRARAHDQLGEFAAARADLERSLAMATAEGDQAERWNAMVELAGGWGAADYRRADALLTEALSLAERLDDRRARAETYNRIGNARLMAERPREAVEAHQQAAAIFEETGDLDGVARTRDLMASALLTMAHCQEAAAEYRSAADYFRGAGQRHALISSLTMFTFCGHQYLGDIICAEGPAAVEREQSISEAIGLAASCEWRAGEAFALLARANLGGAHGRLGDALQDVDRGLALAQEIGHTYWSIVGHIIRGAVLADLLCHDDAVASLRRGVEAAVAVGSDYWRRIGTGILVSVCVSAADRVAARVALAEAADRDTFAWETATTVGQLLIVAARTEIDISEGRADLALDAVGVLRAAGATGIRLADLEGRALIALGRFDEAVAVLESALSLCCALGALPAMFRLESQLVRAHRSARRRNQAEAHATAIVEVAEQLVESVPRDDRRAFRERLAAVVPRLTHRQQRKADRSGLTDREVAVVRLLAEGLTNPDIGERLFLSSRTVEKHVEHILSKLQLANRGQVAGWAVRNGITRPEDT